MSIKIALIQCDAGPQVSENVERCLAMAREAISNGVEAVFLPEMFHYRRRGEGEFYGGELIPGPSSIPFLSLAKEHGVWVLLGSVCEAVPGQDKVYNTSVWINPKGEIAATYRKMHLFEVQLGDKGGVSETQWYMAGDTPVVTDFAAFKMGLSVCFDLRFPELYRGYVQQGADILTVPSSFTRPTGEVHWEVLLKARAIENQCFVVAPNQVGVGAGQVQTYGHSMVVGPWGEVLACGSADQEEVVYAALDVEQLDVVRGRLDSRLN